MSFWKRSLNRFFGNPDNAHLQEEVDYQSIPKSSSDHLNKMVAELENQSKLSSSLKMIMMEENLSSEQVIEYLKIKSQPPSNFLYSEENQLTFEQAQNAFIQYLNKRLDKSNI